METGGEKIKESVGKDVQETTRNEELQEIKKRKRKERRLGKGDCDECEAAKIRACEGYGVKMRVSAAGEGVKVTRRRK